MTGRERMRIAMNLGVADRVPVMCQLSLGHYFLHSGVDPIDIWYTSEGFADALVRMQLRYGFDGILVNLHGRPDNWRDHMVKIDEQAAEKIIRWKNRTCPTLGRFQHKRCQITNSAFRYELLVKFDVLISINRAIRFCP